MISKHTPGPWRWELSLSSKKIQLCGGKPAYDLIVMDFQRWGMQGAQPRFIVDGLMHEANTFNEIVEGREHHKSWFQTLKHPDAKLISSAPDLLEALRIISEYKTPAGGTWNMEIQSLQDIARTAIQKATI